MTNEATTDKPAHKALSAWEWLPAGLLAVLAIVFLATSAESGLHRFSLYIGLGLAPGVLWRLAGKSSWTVHRVCFAVVLVAYLFANPKLRPAATDLDKIVAHWRLVALGLAVSLSQPIWGALRLRLLLADSGIAIGFLPTLKLCLSGSFFNIFLPGATGGDLYRIYVLSAGERRRAGQAVAAITLDRFLGMPPLVLLVLAAAWLDRDFAFGQATLSSLMTFIVVTAVVCLGLMAYLWLGRGKLDKPPAPGEKAGRLRRLHRLLVSHVTAPATLPLTLFYGFWSHVAVIVACICFGRALGVEGIPVLRYFLLVPLASAINAIPGSPGGIGQGEIAMAALLDLAAPGMGNAQAGVVVMLLTRLANILIGLAGGVFYVLGGVDIRRAKAELDDFANETNPCP